jgi:hypothetical protein
MDGMSNWHMRLSTIVLIAALAVFYNAGFFLPVLPGNSNNHVMYLFGTLAIGAILILPFFSKFPSYLAFPFWGLAYLLFLPNLADGDALQHMFTAITLMHAAMVAGITSLTHWYARKLDGYMRRDRVPVESSSAPPLLEDEMESIKYEITRARRYNRPISVIIIQPIAKAFGAVEKAVLSKTLSRIFRRTERLYAMRKQGRYLIFCPETTNSSAEMLVNRIRIMVHREQDVHFNYGLATFPDQELTFEGLLSRAEENLETGAKRKTTVIKAIKTGRLTANNR